MSGSGEVDLSTIRSTVLGELKSKWGWLLALGISLIVLGTLGLWMSFAMTLATVIMFGALLAVGGVFQNGWSSVFVALAARKAAKAGTV